MKRISRLFKRKVWNISLKTPICQGRMVAKTKGKAAYLVVACCVGGTPNNSAFILKIEMNTKNIESASSIAPHLRQTSLVKI